MKTNLKCLENHANNVLEMTKEACMDKDFFVACVCFLLFIHFCMESMSCCRNLGMEYVDMYLVHWPVRLKPWTCYPVPKEEDFEQQLEFEATWAGMEKCLDMGLCRGIGVSNFSSTKIQRLLDFASVPPAINQVW